MKRLFLSATVFTVILLTGCQQPESGMETSGDQQMMDSLLTAYEEAWENEDAAGFDDLLASGFTRTVNDGEGYGIDSLKQVAAGEGDLQNLSIEVGEVVYGDNSAAASWTLSGTMNGREINTVGASFITFQDGKIASDRVILDTTPMTQAMMQGAGEGGAAADTSSM